MSIAVIIGTHGAAAEQLLKTAEMILGEQDNVAYIDFIPGENAETLIDKYNNKLTKLNAKKGVLFLVDTWGGSPFNAASRVSTDRADYEVVAGVNIPMLIEVFMARDDNPEFSQLVTIAVEAGSNGVKALKTPRQDNKKPAVSQATVATVSSTPATANSDAHMEIGLARIDDRLIHGQVATRWTKETNITRIIVVSDEVAADHVRKTLLTQVAPPGITAHVVDIAKAIRVYNNPKYAKDRVMLLFTGPADVLRLVEAGVNITSVNIGGMAFQQGKIQVNNAVSVNPKDIDAFKKLDARGIELEVRKVASDTRLKLMDMISKLNT